MSYLEACGILGVSYNDDLDLIKKSYKSRIKFYHPDNFQGNEEKLKYAEGMTKKINEAWEYIQENYQTKNQSKRNIDIYETQKIILERQTYIEKYYTIEKSIQNIRQDLSTQILKIITIIQRSFTAMFLCIYLPIMAISSADFRTMWFGDPPKLVGVLATWGVSFAIIFLVFTILKHIVEVVIKNKKRKLNKKEHQVMLAYQTKLLEIQTRTAQLSQKLELSDVPIKYHNCDAINWMIDALRDKRADTLKEVINLYEEECYRRETINAINNIQINNE